MSFVLSETVPSAQHPDNQEEADKTNCLVTQAKGAAVTGDVGSAASRLLP